MDTKKFRQLVADAIDKLPDEFRDALENIEIVIEDQAPNEGNFLLLGLYEGVPLDKRSPQFYSGVLPDKITLFRKSIEKYCNGNEAEMADQIRRTFLHEIGHYFGMNDEKLRKLGY